MSTTHEVAQRVLESSSSNIVYDQVENAALGNLRPLSDVHHPSSASIATFSLARAPSRFIPLPKRVQSMQKSNVAVEIELKVQEIAEHGLLHHETIVEIDMNRNLLTDPEVQKLLQKYDRNGDGEFSVEEVSYILNDVIRKKKQFKLMQYGLTVAALLLVILLVANTLLTLWMLKLMKVVDTSNDKNYLTNTKGDLVVTDKPVYYVTIGDLPSLPSEALDALTHLSFSTVDGSQHNYLVHGTRFSTNGTMSIFFTSSKQMVVTGKQMVFSEVLDDGSVNVVNVATDNQVSHRRLQLLQGLDEEALRDLTYRCSLIGGVCYHTLQEIKELNGVQSMDAEEVDVYGNRRLQTASTGTSNYAQIAANIVTGTASGTKRARSTKILVISPGTSMANKDELWSQGSTATSPAPYKMVFVNGDIWLYAQVNAARNWNLPYTLITNQSDWGTPYWKFSTAVKNYITNPPGKLGYTAAQEVSLLNGQGVIFLASATTYNLGILAKAGVTAGESWAAYAYNVTRGNSQSISRLVYSASATPDASGNWANSFTSSQPYGYVTFLSGNTPVFQFRTYSRNMVAFNMLQLLLTSTGNLVLQGAAASGQTQTFFNTGNYVSPAPGAGGPGSVTDWN